MHVNQQVKSTQCALINVAFYLCHEPWNFPLNITFTPFICSFNTRIYSVPNSAIITRLECQVVLALPLEQRLPQVK
ncbi:UNVERIFIED_CONTAM: hypothetical protein FKN15_064568 [Acipenser sinensis]